MTIVDIAALVGEGLDSEAERRATVIILTTAAMAAGAEDTTGPLDDATLERMWSLVMAIEEALLHSEALSDPSTRRDLREVPGGDA